jgi:hypothetical protein
MTRKSHAEHNMRELYGTLKMAQMDSLRTYRRHTVAISADSYVVRRYSSAADATGTVREQRSLKQSLTTSATSLPVVLTFSEKSYPSVNAGGSIPFAVCLASNADGADVDSIVVSQGTINLARKRQGVSCAPANCDLK